MEIALKINNFNDFQGISLKHYKVFLNDEESSINRPIKTLINCLKEQDTIKRVYIGNEFCQWMIPDSYEIDKIVSICNEFSLGLTLLTPPANNSGIREIEKLVSYIEKSFTGSFEIVFNDLGVMVYLRSKMPSIPLICGRIFNKIPNDPRNSLSEYERYFSDIGLLYVQTPGNISKHSIDALKIYDISMIEFDLALQGTNLLEYSEKKAVHYPYSLVTTGRMCLSKNIGTTDKFDLSTSCSRKCQGFIEVLSKDSFKVDNQIQKKGNPCFRKGNTIFTVSDFEYKDFCNCIDRLILRLEP